MNIDSIKNGIVIDHIPAGSAMKLYTYLNLEELDCSVAIIKNVPSQRMGKKDIIKIDADIPVDLDALGYLAPSATVNIIKDEQRVEKKNLSLPEEIRNVITCKNPRCISATEQELPQIFRLTDRENKVYRCIYCESKATKRRDEY